MTPLRHFPWGLIVLMMLLAAGVSTMGAQTRFRMLPVKTGGEITQEVADALRGKTEEILTRNSALAPDTAGHPFEIRADLTVTGKDRTSGLVRNVTTATGELTLTILNSSDGTPCHSVTVPLKSVLNGGSGNMVAEALVRSIRPADTVYTRFIRVARERIAAMYPSDSDTESPSPSSHTPQ
ncbi:MAG: hypothetical protein K2O24_08720 [Muribaculaceae bacterium]|nr:hypothetical protein [Muribaculaceae bacterium]